MAARDEGASMNERIEPQESKPAALDRRLAESVGFDEDFSDEALDRTPLAVVSEYSRRGP
jgi:hypothetical protein